MGIYYDGTKLLSLKDRNGAKPEIYLCTSNRTAGKTTYFSRLLVNRFISHEEKFMILYRFTYELKDSAEKFFSLVQNLFFPEYVMTAEKRDSGHYYELFLNGNSCGYAAALNAADALKKVSNVFSIVKRMMFDEFQSETNVYCPDEVKKFQSVHTTVARGEGEQVRYVPVYMVSNPITLLNPYYVALGISTTLNSSTKFLKGDGFVLEQGHNAAAEEAQRASAFNRAFGASRYTDYAASGIYLNDNMAFVERPSGRSRYIATLRFKGIDFGIRSFAESGIVYADKKPDASFPIRIAVTTEDHQINYVMLKQFEDMIFQLRFYFERGAFRFRDLQSKEAVMTALSYI
jgi:hypothetical protein